MALRNAVNGTTGINMESLNKYCESIDEMLLNYEKSFYSDTVNTDQLILDKLAKRIVSLRVKGCSFAEISLFLNERGVLLSADVLEEHYFMNQDKRISLCEQHVAGYERPEWNAIVERTAFIERGLRQALKDKSGLILLYQPQVDMNTGEVLGAEALVRWECNGNLIHPIEFIPVAENSGLIIPIGELVLREACREAKRWQTIGLGGKRGIKMGVNLSVKQFSKKLPDMVHGILCDADLSTDLLGLEVTESFLVGNDSIDILRTLQKTGIHLSVDDFGTGYSCLSQLKDLPLETIKIDRSFVDKIGFDGKSAAVVEGIINLANSLEMTTLAEGVENEHQVESLRNLGCSVCQGFLYSKPLTGSAFVKYAHGRSDVECFA